jgi:hypothetical protein
VEAAFKRDTVGLQTREQFQTIKANIEKQVQQEKDDAQIAKEECVPPSLATPLGSVGFRRLLLSSPSHATHARGMCCRNELRVRAQKRDSTKKKKPLSKLSFAGALSHCAHHTPAISLCLGSFGCGAAELSGWCRVGAIRRGCCTTGLCGTTQALHPGSGAEPRG